METNNKEKLMKLAREIRAKFPESQSNGGLNQYILNTYKAQTGAKVFKTFKQWKNEGYTIIKGSKGFPIFSRPIGKIKQDKGIEASTEEFKYFGTAILFNELQVKK
jgi:hypothetical protein